MIFSPCFFRHSWGHWTEYEQKDPEVYLKTMTQYWRYSVRQKRTCSLCGYTQDLHVKDGPLYTSSVPPTQSTE